MEHRIAPRRIRPAPSGSLSVARLILALVVLVGTAQCQPRVYEPAPDAPPPTVQELLQRVEQVESELRRLRGDPPAAEQSDGVALLLEGSLLGIGEAQPNDAVRYFLTKLVLINPGPQDVTLAPPQIVLKTGGRTIDPRERPGQIGNTGVRIDGKHTVMKDVPLPESVVIPARGTAAVTLIFAGLDKGPFIPDLRLDVPLPDGVRTIDVNLYERARLGLTTERIGPDGCLALLTVRGELNTINAGSLTAELEQAVAQKLVRAVVAWDASAPPPEDLLRDWLLQAASANAYDNRFRQLPGFPSTLRELHLAAVPGVAGNTGGTSVFASTGDAVSAALRSVFAVISRDDLLRSIREGHVLARAAALEHGATQLDPDAVPIVLALAEGADPTLQLAAIEALGSFPQPQAIERLGRFARDGTPAQAEAALRSLAASRFPAAHRALLGLLTEDLQVPRDLLIRVLAAHPRAEWQDVLLAATRSDQPEVRIEALRALSRLGHPELPAVLADALRSDDAPYRNEAFARLVERADQGDAASDALARDYALKQLEQAPPAGAVQDYLMQTRDQRAVPWLLKYLRAEGANRVQIIRVLEKVGDQSVIEALADGYDTFSEQEKSEVLRVLSALQPQRGRDLALQSLRAQDTQLATQAINLLRTDERDEAVAELAAVMATAKNNTIRHQICNALSAIATPKAREELLKARNSDHEETRKYATIALQNLRRQSPAGPAVESAKALIEAKQYADAAKQLAMAEKLDPQYPDVYEGRGSLRRQTNDTDAAIADFKKAIGLDDQFADAHYGLGEAYFHLKRHTEAIPSLRRAIELDPDNHQAVTSLAISLAIVGDVDEGVRLATGGLEKFKPQRGYAVYLYNVACVYGRALERVRDDPQAGPSDPRVAKYTDEAVAYLQQSIDAGVAEQAATGGEDMFAFMRNDADLKPLHGVPAFRKLSRMDEPARP